jgi:hypothetical protein
VENKIRPSFGQHGNATLLPFAGLESFPIFRRNVMAGEDNCQEVQEKEG